MTIYDSTCNRSKPQTKKAAQNNVFKIAGIVTNSIK